MSELIKIEGFKLTLKKTRSENTTLPFLFTKFTAAVQSNSASELNKLWLVSEWPCRLVWIQSENYFPLGELARMRQILAYWTRAELCQLWAPWKAGNRKKVYMKILGKLSQREMGKQDMGQEELPHLFYQFCLQMYVCQPFPEYF